MSVPDPLDLQVLGSLRVVGPDGPVALGGAKQRAILAILLINRNRIVSFDALCDAVWEDDPPAAVVSSVHVAISGLRRSLRAASSAVPLVETAAPGYRLTAPDGSYDLGRFHELRNDGAELYRSGRPREAAAALAHGLDLWRGETLEDLGGFRFARDFAAAIDEERLLAWQLRIDADLLCSREAAVLPELLELTGRHPLREHFWAQRATVLYRLDRQAEALSTLRLLRESLDDELGVDPSPAIQQLELAILRHDVPTATQDVRRGADLAATIGEPVGSATFDLLTPWGAVFPIATDDVHIGRTPECDVVLADDRVSRHHAVIMVAPQGLLLNDLASRNGTFLNGDRVSGLRELHDGDVIGIGRLALTLRARSVPSAH